MYLVSKKRTHDLSVSQQPSALRKGLFLTIPLHPRTWFGWEESGTHLRSSWRMIPIYWFSSALPTNTNEHFVIQYYINNIVPISNRSHHASLHPVQECVQAHQPIPAVLNEPSGAERKHLYKKLPPPKKKIYILGFFPSWITRPEHEFVQAHQPIPAALE